MGFCVLRAALCESCRATCRAQVLLTCGRTGPGAARWGPGGQGPCCAGQDVARPLRPASGPPGRPAARPPLTPKLPPGLLCCPRLACPRAGRRAPLPRPAPWSRTREGPLPRPAPRAPSGHPTPAASSPTGSRGAAPRLATAGAGPAPADPRTRFRPSRARPRLPRRVATTRSSASLFAYCPPPLATMSLAQT